MIQESKMYELKFVLNGHKLEQLNETLTEVFTRFNFNAGDINDYLQGVIKAERKQALIKIMEDMKRAPKSEVRVPSNRENVEKVDLKYTDDVTPRLSNEDLLKEIKRLTGK